MATLIDLRRRIRSVRNSQQITQAMKTVSTAKFKKAQRTILEARPYWHIFPELAAAIAPWAEESAHPLLSRRREMKIEIVIITSDKGLTGAFNSNLLARVLSFSKEKMATAEVRFVLLGKKAVNFFKKRDLHVDRIYPDKVDKLTREEIRDLAEYLMRLFILHRTDAVYVLYNEFKSILAPSITAARLLPITLDKAGAADGVRPDWEPDMRAMTDSLLPLYVESQLHHALFESQAAEQASRMMAMENATRNAEGIISDLVLLLNKIRQAAITRELLEIMTAVDALSK